MEYIDKNRCCLLFEEENGSIIAFGEKVNGGK